MLVLPMLMLHLGDRIYDRIVNDHRDLLQLPILSSLKTHLCDPRRPRSNSLRVGNLDDILMRRSSSLRQGLLSCGPSTSGRRSSNEELGIPQTTITRPVRLTLNGGIGLEVTVCNAHLNCLIYFTNSCRKYLGNI